MDINALLNKYAQNQLLFGLDGLPENDRAAYTESLAKIDFALLAELYELTKKGPSAGKGKIEPAEAMALSALSAGDKDAFTRRGLELIKNGKCAAVTMAGGQGTRLGYSGPKGCFDIGIGKSLFALQAERLLALASRTGSSIPWYIMTSEENNGDTRTFFRRNGNFGYPTENLFFFTQGMLPMLDTSGKILLSAPGKIASGPDGNGGVFKALVSSGALSDIESRGIEYVFFCGIDNALVRLCDPVFLGFAADSGLPCASKSVLKRSPDEKVGVFCKINGRPGTIEYTELPAELRCATDSDGNLLYGDSNIVAHIIKTEALKAVCNRGLPYHAAFKKAPFVNASGETVVPEMPNAWKFEAFIFDAFAYLDCMAILRVDREQEFAPVKNSEGEDSPRTALALYRRIYHD